MNVVSRKRLQEFWGAHPQAEGPLEAWHGIARKAEWLTPADIKAAFGSADFVADNRVIFNIGGNKYRLIVHVSYTFKALQITFVGTHAEYDAIDAETVE